MEQSNGTFMYHISCPYCGSSDANAVYDNDTTFCFSCERAGTLDKSKSKTFAKRYNKMSKVLLHGEASDLNRRGISKTTCSRYNYTVGTDEQGKTVQIANYYDDKSTIVGQKLRYSDKTFRYIGNAKEALMFGQQLFKSGGIKLTITEGELDALSVSEAFSKGYPVVSIKNGATAAKKEIKANIEWINSFKEIYLWFDNDEAGNKAIEECIPLLPAGKVKIVKHPDYKDANELLTKKGSAGVISTFYNAENYKPDGFVTPDDLLEQALKPIEVGLPWIYPKLTDISYGRRYGEIVTVGAGVAIGKTDFVMQQISKDLEDNHKVATFMLEQGKVETLLRVCGKIDRKYYHLPDTEYKKEDLKKVIHSLNDRLFIYDNFGRIDWETIKSKIRSASVSYGIKLFYIDNLTALNAHADDERRHLDGLMEEIASLAKELNIWILLVSHLNPPKKGESHEAGGRVELGQLTGSRAIMRWSQFVLGIERNTLHDDPDERSKGLVRCLKDRFSGKATGQTVGFIYDKDIGICFDSDEDFEISVSKESEEDF